MCAVVVGHVVQRTCAAYNMTATCMHTIGRLGGLQGFLHSSASLPFGLEVALKFALLGGSVRPGRLGLSIT